MKFGFSTLGCPGWDYNEVVATALDLGYDGIEIRGLSQQMYAPKMKAFSEENIGSSLRKLKALEIPMLTTNACIAVEGEADSAVSEVADYIELARKLGSKYIRILCTNTAAPSGGDYDLAVNTYKRILEMSKGTGVLPLIETNGIFCDSALLARFIEEVGGDAAVLWDIHHPYRFGGEAVSTTLKNIGKYVKYVHFKDSIVKDGKVVYKMLGHGDLPLQDVIDALKSINYDGYITLEWTKRWNPDLEEPGICFAQYITAIREYLK